LLEDSQLVRAAPPLDHFAVPKSRDLNPACVNLPSRRSYAQKFALLRASNRVRNGYLVLVGYHLVHGDCQIRERCSQGGEHANVAFWTLSLIARRVVIQDIRGDKIAQQFQFPAVYGAAKLLLYR
jgi:hypothetical protein